VRVRSSVLAARVAGSHLCSVFSKRANLPLEPNEVAECLARLRTEGREIRDLTVSNPTRVGLPLQPELLQVLAHPRGQAYAPDAFGAYEARVVVAGASKARGFPVRPEEVMLTASTSEAYAVLMKLLCDPGDNILVPRPSYPLFEHLARLEGVEIQSYPLGFDGAWHIDWDGLERARTPRTRAIVMVHPNNPTGSYVSRSELQRMGSLGLPIIADEVFSDYPLAIDRAAAQSALELSSGLVFVMGGLSKSFALPQLKLAWTIVGGEPRLRQEALGHLELIMDTYLSVSTPLQLALPELFERAAPRRAWVQERLRTNLTTLSTEVAGTAVTLLPLHGGWSAVLRLPRTRTETEWVLGLLETEGLLVQPGWFYDFTEEAYVVLSLLPEPKTFRAAVQSLVSFVER
jgi:alanine-synthesizing transaminase